ncbi:alpha/beta hydrolase-fold protein [Terrilactibacillus sp. S3-3]|nr:alpha/beta hydrolase-fold protein [Terrilactibacillus sp. S3-3]
MKSALLNRSLTLICYLPPQYDPSSTYPLLISQDGRDYIQLGRLARICDQMIDEGKIHDLVIAAIPYENRDERWELYHPDGLFHHAYMRSLVEEVLPLIKEHYTISDLASERTLIGDSLGGTLSLTTALAYPRAFANIVMQSPYIDERIIQQVKESQDILSFSIYHTIGIKKNGRQNNQGIRPKFS